jgi:dihydroflavonol-4-reductase
MEGRLNLVTGGAGFIGRHLVQELRQAGERVRVLDRAAGPALPAEVEPILGSVADPLAVRRAMQGVERVFHLAANPDLWAADKGDFESSNRRGTEIVLAEAERAQVARFVHCSTESILKGGRAPGPIDETAGPSLKEMPGPYCRSKFLAEQAALAAAARGLPVVVVNPTLPVGPGDHRLTPPTRMILMFLNRPPPFFLDCAFNMVDARDIARGHVLAAEKGRIGERYILGGVNLTMAEFLIRLEKVCGRVMPRRTLPYGVALAVGLFSEWVADFLTHKPPLAPLAGVRLAASPMIFDGRKAAGELGFAARPLDQSLAEEVSWLAAQGLIRPPPPGR